VPVPSQYESSTSVLIAEITPPKVYSKILTRQEIESLVSQYDWDRDIAVHIAYCESSFNASVVNDNPNTRDYSIGLFQINLYGANAKYRPSEQWLKNPENNIAYAFELYQNGGWNHWRNCYNKF